MKKQNWNNIETGLVVGAVGAFLIAAAIDSQILNFSSENWATLIAAAATLSAGWLALRGPWAQINQQYEISERKERAQRVAARALLPLAASELHRIGTSALEICCKDEQFFKDITNRGEAVRSCSVSPDLLNTLHRCLEYSAPNERVMLQIILSHYQICHARLDAWFGTDVVNPHLDLAAGNCAIWTVFLGLVGHLYDLGRKDLVDIEGEINFDYFGNYMRIYDLSGSVELEREVRSQVQRWIERYHGLKLSEVRKKMYDRQ